jgi:hypothetical protein
MVDIQRLTRFENASSFLIVFNRLTMMIFMILLHLSILFRRCAMIEAVRNGYIRFAFFFDIKLNVA